MLKSKAIELLGGTPTSAAAEIGITPQAVTDWPEHLPQRIADRVQAALWRKQNPEKVRALMSNKRARAAGRQDRPVARNRESGGRA
jgi:hypothetical protein